MFYLLRSRIHPFLCVLVIDATPNLKASRPRLEGLFSRPVIAWA